MQIDTPAINPNTVINTLGVVEQRGGALSAPDGLAWFDHVKWQMDV